MQIAPESSKADIPTQYCALALAYLDCSQRLCGEMVDGVWEANYNRGQAVIWLAFHATELVLKGCILSVDTKRARNIHSLRELSVSFTAHFPDLSFEPPFGSEAMPSSSDGDKWELEVDRTLHMQFRYPRNQAGSSWPGVRCFDPHLFSAELERLRCDFERILSEVFGK